MSEWQLIETAPRDKTVVEIAWVRPDGKIDHGPFLSWWENGEWHNHWTPTHWRPQRPTPVHRGVR